MRSAESDELIKWVRDELHKYRPQFSVLKMEDLRPQRAVIYAAARGDRGDITFDSKGERSSTAVHNAVRCSISIPYFFQSQEIDNRWVYDGGLLNNYPLDIFLKQQKEKWLIDFGALYIGQVAPTPLRSRWIIGDLLAIWLDRNDADVVDRFVNNTVIVDTSPVGTIDFDLTDDEKNFLVVVGRAAALKFMHNRGVLEPSRLALVQQTNDEAERARTRIVAVRRRRRRRRSLLAGIAVLAIATLAWWVFA